MLLLEIWNNYFSQQTVTAKVKSEICQEYIPINFDTCQPIEQ